MEKFAGLTNKQIRRGLKRFNGLKKFRRNEDIFYSSDGKFIVLGPSSVSVTRNLITGKKPRVEINWKVFHSSNLKNGIALQKKIFIMIEYEVKFPDGSEMEHLAILLVDPQEKVARYIDSFTECFDKINSDALQREIPWEVMYGEKEIILYIFKYHGGIKDSCTLDCLHSIDRIMHLNSFTKAATECLFLRRVRRFQNQEINIQSPYEKMEEIWFYNGIRYCHDVLLKTKVIKQQ